MRWTVEQLRELCLKQDRNAIIEECAQIALKRGSYEASLIANDIRALKDKP